MVAYSFDRMHERAVESGAKLMTIRRPRARHARPGEELQLYSSRGKGRRLLRRAVCEAVRDVELVIDGGTLRQAVIDGEAVNPGVLARDDGFASPGDMAAFFMRYHGGEAEGRLDFRGVLIAWR